MGYNVFILQLIVKIGNGEAYQESADSDFTLTWAKTTAGKVGLALLGVAFLIGFLVQVGGWVGCRLHVSTTMHTTCQLAWLPLSAQHQHSTAPAAPLAMLIETAASMHHAELVLFSNGLWVTGLVRVPRRWTGRSALAGTETTATMRPAGSCSSSLVLATWAMLHAAACSWRCLCCSSRR